MNTPTLRFGTERSLVQIQSPRQKQRPQRKRARGRAAQGGGYETALTDIVEMFGVPFDEAVRR